MQPTERDLAPAPTPLYVAARLSHGADRVLTAVLYLALLAALLFSGYALWDNWRIYSGAQLDESLLKYKPVLGEDNRAKFEELMAINPDVCAWITVDDTNIDYPVVQGEDNTHYLNTDVYGEFSLSGSIFLDYRNARDFSDAYSLIYGHHMEGGAMFGDVKNFTDSEYFNEHPTATLFTPDHTYRVELFACLETDAYDTQVYGVESGVQADVGALVERLASEAVQYRDVGVNSDDRIVALSTCSTAATNARTLVFGRLVDITEGGDSAQ